MRDTVKDTADGIVALIREDRETAEALIAKMEADHAAIVEYLYEALKAVEWSGNEKGTVCPVCGWNTHTGHAPGCIIGNAIRKAEGGGE